MSPHVQTNFKTSKIRVALIIEGGKIKPVWFEETDKPARDRVLIKSVNFSWLSQEGAAKVMHFGVTGGDATIYKLSLNTREFTWTLGIAEETP